MSEFVDERNWEWEGSKVYFKHADGERELRFSKAGSRIRGADSGLYSARAYRAGEALGYYCGNSDEERWKVGGKEAEDKRIEVLGTNAGRYVVELAGWYVVCDDTRRNPAGLPNDAGAEHANVRCLGSGKMEALRDIAIGEELYWCYGDAYWNYWSRRIARNKLTREEADAASWAVVEAATTGGEGGTRGTEGWRGATGRPPGEGGEGGHG